MNTIKSVTDLLYREGEPMQDGDLALEDAKKLGSSHASRKPFRIVRDWIWADLDVGEKITADLEHQGLGVFQGSFRQFAYLLAWQLGKNHTVNQLYTVLHFRDTQHCLYFAR